MITAECDVCNAAWTSRPLPGTVREAGSAGQRRAARCQWPERPQVHLKLLVWAHGKINALHTVSHGPTVWIRAAQWAKQAFLVDKLWCCPFAFKNPVLARLASCIVTLNIGPTSNILVPISHTKLKSYWKLQKFSLNSKISQKP